MSSFFYLKAHQPSNLQIQTHNVTPREGFSVSVTLSNLRGQSSGKAPPYSWLTIPNYSCCLTFFPWYLLEVGRIFGVTLPTWYPLVFHSSVFYLFLPLSCKEFVAFYLRASRIHRDPLLTGLPLLLLCPPPFTCYSPLLLNCSPDLVFIPYLYIKIKFYLGLFSFVFHFVSSFLTILRTVTHWPLSIGLHLHRWSLKGLGSSLVY